MSRADTLDPSLFMDVPTAYLAAEDWQFDPADELRVRTLEPDDPVGLYHGYPEVQRDMIAREKAGKRLGLDAVSADVILDSTVLETHAAAWRLQEILKPSSLHAFEALSAELGSSVHVKMENTRPPAYTFKDRGAYNKIAKLSPDERARGVVAASAGNHAQGVALAARAFGVPALIFMPVTTPEIKQEAVRNFGAEVVLVGETFDDTAEHTEKFLANTENPPALIPPFDDADVMAGQGTVGKEIIEQMPTASHLFVQAGGGGLLGGVAQYIKKVRPDVQIIGVEHERSNCAQVAWLSGEPVVLAEVDTFAEGMAVREVGALTHAAIRGNVDDFVTVSTAEIRSAMKEIHRTTGTISETSGAVSLAGLVAFAKTRRLSDQNLVAVCTGGNIGSKRFYDLIAPPAQD